MKHTLVATLSSMCLVAGCTAAKDSAPADKAEGALTKSGAAEVAGKEQGAAPAPAAPGAVEAAMPVDPTAVDSAATPAPDFTLEDLDGRSVTLSELRGKIVVLEWFNPGCPFVKYAHGKGPLATLAAQHSAKGITWLAINSGAKGKQGHGIETNRKAAAEWKMTHPVLIDEDGVVGKAYGAKTTPHMFIVDAKGTLVYRGGLDNSPLGEAPEGGRIDYVSQALEAVGAGRSVGQAETKPYGCSVKYGS